MGDGVWTVQYDPNPPVYVSYVFALGKNAIYVCSDGAGLLTSGGDGRWHSVIVDPTKPTLYLNSVWGTSPENLYVLGPTGMYHGVKP
jgi:photosystem II stability/assembly factor-like uncharacterized protein